MDFLELSITFFSGETGSAKLLKIKFYLRITELVFICFFLSLYIYIYGFIFIWFFIWFLIFPNYYAQHIHFLDMVK